MLGLRFCARAFSSCGERGPLFIAVHRPLTVVASFVAEHRLQTRRLSSCGSRAQLLRGMWDLPRSGLEPVSPALAGRFSTAAPPGKPCCFILRCVLHLQFGLLHSINPSCSPFICKAIHFSTLPWISPAAGNDNSLPSSPELIYPRVGHSEFFPRKGRSPSLVAGLWDLKTPNNERSCSTNRRGAVQRVSHSWVQSLLGLNYTPPFYG